MGSIKSIEMTIPEICSDITDVFEKTLTQQLLEYFSQNGYTYLVSATNPKRIYCYIKKSKETMIINKETYLDRLSNGGYSIQLRITSPKTYASLDHYSSSIRNQILNGKNCKSPHCCNCGHWYEFDYNGTSYKKCHMLCDNYSFSNLTEQDVESLFSIIANESHS